MDKIFKIAAYITSYEDKTALARCIQSIYNQSYAVDKIFIIDNSKIRISNLDSQKIIIEHHPENIGISQGLSFALQWAINCKYHFLWTFDQDSEAQPNALETLLTSYIYLEQQEISTGILSPKVIDLKSENEICGLIFNRYRFHKNLNYQTYSQNIYECDVTITSGSLINLKIAKNLDFPDPRLFIDAVDFYYCMLFREKGYKIFIDKNAMIIHNFGNYTNHRYSLAFHRKPVYCYSAIRYYYMIRNHTWLELRLSQTFYFKIACIIHRFVKFFKNCIKIIFYESSPKRTKLYACVRGLFDGLTGSLEKRWTI